MKWKTLDKYETVKTWLEVIDPKLNTRRNYLTGLQEYVDFQGSRHQGSDSLCLAIYNKNQPSQSSGLQLFVEFHNGLVKYGIYRHSDRSYTKRTKRVYSRKFSF